MENNIRENIEKSQEIKEKMLEKNKDSFQQEIPEEKIEKLLNTKNKALEIKEQLKEQQGLSFKLGLKKRNTTLIDEFDALHEEYKETLKSLEDYGFSRELIAEKELELNLNRKKEEAEKLVQELTPKKIKLFEKLKNVLGLNKNNIENKFDIPDKIPLNLEEERNNIINSGVADEFLKDYKDRFPQDPKNNNGKVSKGDTLNERLRSFNEEQKEELDLFEEDNKEVDIEEDVSIDANLAGRYRNFDEDQINKKKEEMENEIDLKTESFNTRDIPSEEEIKKKHEKIKEEEEEEKEKIEESMDRPSI